MSRAIGTILQVVAAAAVFVTTGNVTLSALAFAAVGAANKAIGIGPKAAPPETTEQSIKTERPARVRALGRSRLYGASICFETVNGTTIDVWAFHDGKAHAILRTYLNDNQVSVSGNVVQPLADKSYQHGLVKLGYSMGLPTGTAFGAVSALLPAWDANHRGDGVVLGYLLKAPEKEKDFLTTYPQGDQVTLSLVGEWTPKHDPRVPSSNPYDPSTWPWSDNAVLAFVWYLMVERDFDWNTRIAPQLPLLLAAINDADRDMPLAAGGSEKRYRTALSYKATEEPANVIGSLLACFDGWYCLNELGQLIVYSGRFYEPTVSIGPDQIVSFSHQAGVADEDVVNEIAVPYVSDLHDFNTVDGEPWRDEDDINRRGRLSTAQLEAVVPSHTQGRRLAKRKMSRANAEDRGTVTTNFSGRPVLGQRYIRLNLTEGGATFFDGVAEITAVERDQNTGGVTFEWVAADRNADTWNPLTEDGEPAPTGNRYVTEPLAAPTVGSITKTYGQDASYATPGVKLTVIASGPADRSDLTWIVRTRPLTGVAWLEQVYPDVDPGLSVTLQTDFLPLTELEVQVAYRTGDGRLSPWGILGAGTIDTGSVLPGAVANLSVSANADGTLIAGDWDDADFASRYLVEVIVEA